MMNNPYDRINIQIGEYQLTARPIAFQYDADNNVTAATEFETTCPGCGDLIIFQGAQSQVGCSQCKYGMDKAIKVPKEVMTVKFSGQHVEQPVAVGDVCPFIDPIEEKLFDPQEL